MYTIVMIKIQKFWETDYLPILKSLIESGEFKSERQQKVWKDQVMGSLVHTKDILESIAKSNIVTGVEYISDNCCDNCNKNDGVIYRNGDAMPILPFIECTEMRKGKYCKCVLSSTVD